MDKYRNLEEGQADVINCPLGLECPEVKCRNWQKCCYVAEKSAREYGFAPALDLLSANYHRERLSQLNFDSSEPEEFCQYLIDLGWEKFIPTQRVLADLVSSGRAVTFKKAKNGTDRHILFPLDRQTPDYDSRIYDALKVLSAVEGRPARDLVYMRLDSLQKFYEHSAIQRSLGN